MYQSLSLKTIKTGIKTTSTYTERKETERATITTATKTTKLQKKIKNRS